MRQMCALALSLGFLCSHHVRLTALHSGTASGAATSADQPPLARLRSERPSIAALIDKATAWSVTFRLLRERIDTTDGLVYVDEGKCGHGVRACLLLSLHRAGPFRLLRVLIDSRQRDECDTMASIGHELQHVLEALSDDKVIDYHTMYSFFQREGPTGDERFETSAALRAGYHVFDEACARGR